MNTGQVLMKIMLLGASGRTGQEVLQRLLGVGDAVTALVRTADALKDFKSPQLNVHQGDVCDRGTLSALFDGQDAVISCLGPRSMSDSACSIYSRSAAAIVPAMEQCRVERLLVTSTALLFPSRGFTDGLLRMIARNNAHHAFEMEDTICASKLGWTLARVGFLNSGDDNRYRCEIGSFPGGGISRKALATYLCEEVHQDRHVRKIVGLAG